MSLLAYNTAPQPLKYLKSVWTLQCIFMTLQTFWNYENNNLSNIVRNVYCIYVALQIYMIKILIFLQEYFEISLGEICLDLWCLSILTVFFFRSRKKIRFAITKARTSKHILNIAYNAYAVVVYHVHLVPVGTLLITTDIINLIWPGFSTL